MTNDAARHLLTDLHKRIFAEFRRHQLLAPAHRRADLSAHMATLRDLTDQKLRLPHS